MVGAALRRKVPYKTENTNLQPKGNEIPYGYNRLIIA